MAKRTIIRGKVLPWALMGTTAERVSRTLYLNLREHRLGDAKAGLLKLSDGLIEVDESGLFGFIENRKGSCNPQASANGLLTPSLLIHEHHICMYLHRKRDRFTLAWIELPKNEAALGTQDFYPCRRLNGPVLHRFRREWMLEFCQHSRRNKNSRV